MASASPQPPSEPVRGSHYFDAHPTVASAEEEATLHLPDLSLRFRTDRGVFGHGGVDPGTKFLLLESTEVPGRGNLLDLGCGYGPIAVALGRRAPGASVVAVDINERARALCAANAEANGAPNVRVYGPDEVPEDLRFAAMWSNPPIRIGKPALHTMLSRWLPRVETGGVAWLVVHKHLGSDSMAAWLNEQGFATSRLASRHGYRILRVEGRS